MVLQIILNPAKVFDKSILEGLYLGGPFNPIRTGGEEDPTPLRCFALYSKILQTTHT